MCPVGDPAELYFSLYNGAKNEFVTEEYLVLMTAMGMPQDLNKLGKLKTVFTDIPTRELQAGDLYLVMRIIKRTKAPGSDDSKKPIRRPFGVAVLPLGSKTTESVLVLNKELEHTVPVFAPATETSFPSLHELILKNNFQLTKNGPLVEVPNSRGVCIALTLHQGDVSAHTETRCVTNRKTLPESIALNYLRNDLYITLHSGEFVKDRMASNKNIQALFSVHTGNGDIVNECIFKGSGTAGVAETDSLVFAHVNSPVWDEMFWVHFPSPISLDWYQDKWLFVQFFHQADKGKEREELAHAFLKLSKDDGPVIDDGMHTLSCYKPSPIPFPPNLAQKEGLKKGDHIKIKIQLTSTELTSNSYIYGLLRWKINPAGIEDVLKKFIFIEAGEIVKFMADVCSTIFEIMEAKEELSLLSFDALVFIFGLGSRVSNALDKYLANQFKSPYVHRHLLSCLKHYLTQQGDPVNSSKMLSTFKSLAYIFKFIISSRSLYVKLTTSKDSEKPIIPLKNDTFSKDMLEVFDLFTELMKNNSPQMRGPQSSALKNISSIFGDLQSVFTKTELSKIIARFIQSVQYSPQLELLNKEKLILINKLACSSPLFLDIESLGILLPPVLYQTGMHLRGSHHDEILQSILILSVIANTFQTKVRSEELIFTVLEHLPAVMSAVRTLREEVDYAGEPLVCLLALLKMASRAVFEKYLHSLGDWNAQAEFLTDLFALLQEMIDGHSLSSLSSSLLSPSVSLSSSASPAPPSPSSSHPPSIANTRSNSSSALSSSPSLSSPLSSSPARSMPMKMPTHSSSASLLSLSSSPSLSSSSSPPITAIPTTIATANNTIATTIATTTEEQVVLSPLAQLSNSLYVPITTTPFPNHWLFINMFAYGTVLKMIDYINEYMIKKYTSELNKTTKALWERVLSLIIVFIRARPLAVENYSPLKRNLVLERYNDMRKPMSQILLKVWKALRPADQMTFLRDLIGPVINLMMMEPEFIQDTAISMYYGLVELEVKETKTNKNVEAQTIDSLDACAYESSLPDHFSSFFVNRLQTAFSESKTPLLVQLGKKFISDITYLLDLLTDLSKLPNSIVFEDERVEAIVKLMEYLKTTGRTTSYLKYVHMLESIHAASGNFGEAGHTILLHADLMLWNDDLVDPAGIFPRESQRNRKERLYKAALDYFDKGKLWEEAIKLIKELRIEYEFTLYDYQKLADILDTQATLVRKISTIDRFFPEYFRVGFYGKGFDPEHEGKEYVFRGLELEDRTDFVARIQVRFPNSKLLNFTEPPPENIITSPDQHIQVFSVKPASEDENVNPDMPQSILKYHQLNNRKVFWYSKPYKKKTTKEKENEFKTLWVRNYSYNTGGNLPGIRRRVEILKTDTVEIPPVQNALNTMEAKNVELAQFARKYEMGHEDSKNISPFTMAIKGAIDAPVNGGVDLYIQLFVTPDYLKESPQDVEIVRRLIKAIQTQAVLLDRTLGIHKRFCGTALGPLQEMMEQELVNKKQTAEKLVMPTA